jgi:hypothetical protein
MAMASGFDLTFFILFWNSKMTAKYFRAMKLGHSSPPKPIPTTPILREVTSYKNSKMAANNRK